MTVVSICSIERYGIMKKITNKNHENQSGSLGEVSSKDVSEQNMSRSYHNTYNYMVGNRNIIHVYRHNFKKSQFFCKIVYLPTIFILKSDSLIFWFDARREKLRTK